MAKKSKNRKRKELRAKRQKSSSFLYKENEELEEKTIHFISALVYRKMYGDSFFCDLEDSAPEKAERILGTVMMCKAAWYATQNFGSYEEALQVPLKIDDPGEIPLPERTVMKVTWFLAVREIFLKPFTPDCLTKGAEIIMTPEEIVYWRTAGPEIY